MLEIKDIFQEYIDEYHMVKDVPYDTFAMGYNIPENIYYSVGLYGKDWPNSNFACIEVWCDSPDGNFSSGVHVNTFGTEKFDYITIIAYPYIKTGVGWNVSITKFANSMSKFKDRVQSVGYECECRWFGNTYKIIITSR